MHCFRVSISPAVRPTLIRQMYIRLPEEHGCCARFVRCMRLRGMTWVCSVNYLVVAIVCVCVGGSGGVDGGERIRDYICQNFGFSSSSLRRAYAELWIV